uniref:Uncharacterized protein n=1 Tax=Rhizophora mucronata TaxID=61149 RepID=A0A2P2ME57_RHIMU
MHERHNIEAQSSCFFESLLTNIICGYSAFQLCYIVIKCFPCCSILACF